MVRNKSEADICCNPRKADSVLGVLHGYVLPFLRVSLHLCKEEGSIQNTKNGLIAA